jgi:Putative auto-transporter adhesin, head GIN domain
MSEKTTTYFFMSNLSIYCGNFVTFVDSEFSFNGSNRRSFSGVNLLDLSVSCHVGVFPSQTEEVTIEIDAEDSNDFSVTCEGGSLIVKEVSVDRSGNMIVSNSSGVVQINGVNFNTGGRSVSMIDGRIFIGGREVNPNDPSQLLESPKRQPRIKIFAPHGVSLTAKLNGVSVLASKVVFRKASVTVSGQSTVGLATKSLTLKVAGQGENFAVLKGGDLTASVSGQGSVRVKGEWESTDVSVSGMGKIQTDGVCTGDYDASVSGMGSISHSGDIRGRKHKSFSGMGSISI